MNARNKKHANETLRILRAKTHTVDAHTIKSRAILNGQNPKAGDEIAELATKIQAPRSKPSIEAFQADSSGGTDKRYASNEA